MKYIKHLILVFIIVACWSETALASRIWPWAQDQYGSILENAAHTSQTYNGTACSATPTWVVYGRFTLTPTWTGCPTCWAIDTFWVGDWAGYMNWPTKVCGDRYTFNTFTGAMTGSAPRSSQWSSGYTEPSGAFGISDGISPGAFYDRNARVNTRKYLLNESTGQYGLLESSVQWLKVGDLKYHVPPNRESSNQFIGGVYHFGDNGNWSQPYSQIIANGGPYGNVQDEIDPATTSPKINNYLDYYYNPGTRFDLTTNLPAKITLPAARQGHTSTLLANGKVLFLGGGSINNALLDLLTDTWESASTPNNIYYHTATLLNDGRVLVTGGSVGGVTVKTARLYDPVTNIWSDASSMATQRRAHTATLLPDGKVLVAGGIDDASTVHKSAELYDPATNSWSPVADMPGLRYAAAAVLLQNGKMLVAGGSDVPGTSLKSAVLYDPATNSWAATGDMNVARYAPGIAMLSNGTAVVIGGLGGSALSTIEMYYPAETPEAITAGTGTGIWKNTYGQPLVSARYHAATTHLPDGKVLVTGGLNGSVLADAELFELVVGDNIYNRSSYNTQLVPAYTPAGPSTALFSGTKWLPQAQTTLTTSSYLTSQRDGSRWQPMGWDGGTGRVSATGNAATASLSASTAASSLRWKYAKHYRTRIVGDNPAPINVLTKMPDWVKNEFEAQYVMQGFTKIPTTVTVPTVTTNTEYWTPASSSTITVPETITRNYNGVDENWVLETPEMPSWATITCETANNKCTIQQTRQLLSWTYNFVYTKRQNVTVSVSGIDDADKATLYSLPGFTPLVRNTAGFTVPANKVTYRLNDTPNISAPNVIYASNNTVRYVLTGWTGTGSIAGGNASGGMITTATPTIENNSTIIWNYQKQVRITVTTSGEDVPIQVFDLTGDTAVGSVTVTNITSSGVLNSNNIAGNLAAGMTVSGYGIPDGTTISAVNSASRTITLSAAATQALRVKLSFATVPAGGSADPRECASPTYDAIVCANNANAMKSGIHFYDVFSSNPLRESTISLTARQSFVDPVSGLTRTLTQVLPSGGGLAIAYQIDNGRKALTSFSLSTPMTVLWRYEQTKAFPIGKPIEAPDGLNVDFSKIPTITVGGITPKDITGDSPLDGFVWAWDSSVPSKQRMKYFPVRPLDSFTIKWPLLDGSISPETGKTIWPTKQKHIAKTPANLQPPGAVKTFNSITYSTNASEATLAVFNAQTAGTSVIRFTTPPILPDLVPGAEFIVVETETLNQAQLVENNAAIGKKIHYDDHADPENKTGYLFNDGGVYDGTGPDKAYDRATRIGAIIPVNESLTGDVNPLVVVWYEKGQGNIGWPVTPMRYRAVWPTTASDPPLKTITIGIGETGPSAANPRAMVYNQPVSAQPGFNPNEEHASLLPGGTLYALRDDLNSINNLSKPYVLLKYYDSTIQEWKMDVYKVARPASFSYTVEAGSPIVAPLPPGQIPLVSDIKKQIVANVESEVGGEWHLRDHKGGHWAKSANWNDGDNILDADKSRFVMQWYYYMRSDFYWPVKSGYQLKKEGDVVPFLNNGSRTDNSYMDNDKPIDVVYITKWPAEAPVLAVGDTLTTKRDGLPDLYNFSSAEVVFDENVYKGKGPLAKLYAPERYLYVPLTALPAAIKTETGSGGVLTFPELPFALQARLFYDKDNKRLGFKGTWISAEGETPWLLHNIMTKDEKATVKGINKNSGDTAYGKWNTAVDELYELTRNPNKVVYPDDVLASLAPYFQLYDFSTPYWQSVWLNLGFWQSQWGIPLGLELRNSKVVAARSEVGEKNALTAGMAQGAGYVVIAENNNAALNAAPVQLHVIKVSKDTVFKGVIKAIKSKNLFDEKLTLHYTGDFGGEPEKFNFEWYYQGVAGSMPNLPLPGVIPATEAWQKFMVPGNTTGAGMSDITIEGASPLTMSDNWFAARYYYKNAWPVPISVPSDPVNPATPHDDLNNWSGWSGASFFEPMLATGWIKRVIDGLNPLEARVTDFRNSATNTTVSMLSQFGGRFDGAIAMNSDPANLNALGLIPAYETVLNRGREFSIDAVPPQNYGPTNDALLNITSRLATFYLAIGNEAYADAVDPTIGFSTKSAEYGNMAPSVFAFQNQLDSLLEEELALLRGRDDSASTTRNAPYYNRLIWNFTQSEGEVAYAQNYNITDQDNSGVINAGDAKIMYPQGHGDAWGHYLQSINYYYKLLGHPSFSWVPRVEFVLVAGNPIMVDYLDERKFASIAAARAKVGAEILDLTYKKFYTDDPAGQWQGYKDTYPNRAWGVDEWARRAGQGAFFDWVTANAILPDSIPATAHDRIKYVKDANGALIAETIPGAGIQQIDRSKTPELASIASQFHKIQAKMTEVDSGINPLGLVNGVVPFDIDPVQVDAGQTHFEQVYERAEKALASAIVVYDYANGYTQRLRQNQDTLEEFKKNLNDQERDYRNRLIEIFGYPYADDIGAGKTYPDGYDGPDIFHYNYVDLTELTGKSSTGYKTYTSSFTLPSTFWNLGGLNNTGLTEITHNVTYNVDGQHHWLVKPAAWTSKRRAPGRTQQALSELIVAEAAFNKAIQEYEDLLGGIEEAKKNLEVRHGVLAEQIALRDTNEVMQIGLDTAIVALHTAGIGFKRASAIYAGTADGIVEALPKVVGTAFDAVAPARGTIKTVNSTIVNVLDIIGDVADGLEFAATTTKDRLQAGMELKLTKSDANWEVYQMVQELQNMFSDVDLKLLETYSLKETLQQASGNYQAVLAEGLRLMDERTEKRAQSSADVQEYRFQDLGFRVFRNDAIQKYRAQFDLAAKYVYLAAMAYDYETNLLGTASGAGRKFMGEIARQSSLGVVSNGTPMAGFPGLADVMARLSQNFSVYKSQLGFNNPQTETTPFSLRTELFRIRGDAASDADWQNVLKEHKVDDLWKIPEFKRYCRPFAPESAGPQPGIVIKFPTTVTYGKNFFGWPLSGGDSAYSTSNFSTRVRSAGLWFQNYNASGLSSTPRVYLVPTGVDVLRSPTGDGFATREWQVRDQKLPVPFPIGASDLKNPDYIAANDSLSDEMAAIRKVSDFRAYPYSGAFDASQTTSDSRLIGRSVWNSQWMLIIPGSTLLFNKEVGLNTFINSVDDIKMFFQTYAYSGN